MKKSLIYFSFFVCLYSFSQAMVVTDISANETLASQLASSTQQLTQLEKNYEILKEAHEKYKKINSIVTSVYKLSEIIKLQTEAIDNVRIVAENTKFEGRSKERLLSVLNNTLSSISERVETISNVLNEGFFSMSDKERIDLFKEERSAIFFLVGKTRGYANPYRARD